MIWGVIGAVLGRLRKYFSKPGLSETSRDALSTFFLKHFMNAGNFLKKPKVGMNLKKKAEGDDKDKD